MDYLLCLAIQFYTGVGDTPYTVLFQGDFFDIVSTVDGKVVVFCDGTKNLKEQLDNFRFFFHTTDGFPTGWWQAAWKISAKVDELDLDLSAIIGFSRGGAIALIYSYYNPTVCIAFSPPKVCKEVRTWELGPILLYCADDIVVRLPPGFYYPSNYCTKILQKGGHFWKTKKYLTL